MTPEEKKEIVNSLKAELPAAMQDAVVRKLEEFVDKKLNEVLELKMERAIPKFFGRTVVQIREYLSAQIK